MTESNPLSDYAKLLGAKGGRKTAENMTPIERKIRAKKAVMAREKKRLLRKKSGGTV